MLSSTWQVSGTLTVQLENGEEVEVDAAAYMAELKAEAQRLRAELSSAKAEEDGAHGALATSLSAYVSKLPEDQLKALTSGITDDVVSAMRMLVAYILRRPGPEGEAPSDDGARDRREIAARSPRGRREIAARSPRDSREIPARLPIVGLRAMTHQR